MGKPTGFLEYKRETPAMRTPAERVKDYQELYLDFSNKKAEKQAARCMDCGVPFCHQGCPLGNFIPEFNDAIYRQNWEEAYRILSMTNNFPEFTGRICPAPCEGSCVLGINNPPVTIHYNERYIIENAFKFGYVKPQIPRKRTGKRVAVVGSGPAGLAAAAQLNKAGHTVTVFERADRIGGLLRYGIPDFKLEKWVIDRRLRLMEEEGIQFRVNTNVGVDVSAKELLDGFDAIVLSGGSTIPRALDIPGASLKGVHFAMDFLTQQNRRVAGDKTDKKDDILAKGKHVVVIGGGDTGSDCVGTSNRQGAKSITQIEVLPKPPALRSEANPWPEQPRVLKTSSSHEEGCERFWNILTKEFVADDKGCVKALRIADIVWEKPDQVSRPVMKEVEGSEREIPCDLALLAIGFLYPQKAGIIEQSGVELDARGNVKSVDYQTNIPQVFVAGDMRTGQSLVVNCITEGREAARAVDAWLMGNSTLETIQTSLFNVGAW